MPRSTRAGGEPDDLPLREALVEAFNAALDETGDLGESLQISFEAGNIHMRQRSDDMIPAERIVAAVAARHGLGMTAMYSHVRSSLVTHPRAIAWWLIRKHVGMSYPAIGLLFRGFDHSSVFAGCRRVEGSPALMGIALEIEKNLFPPGSDATMPIRLTTTTESTGSL
jgi:Bacterial dnaA protein helix-turn-helix